MLSQALPDWCAPLALRAIYRARMGRISLHKLAIWAAAVAILGACGQGTISEPTAATPPVVEVSYDSAPAIAAEVAPPTKEIAQPWSFDINAPVPANSRLVAHARGEVRVFGQPDDSSLVQTLPPTTILGTPTVALLTAEPTEDGWIRIMLPVRPNGSEGWVRADEVDLFLVEGELVIDLSDRTLTYEVGGETILSSTVAVGTSRNPTPTGLFFVTDNVTLANPDSPWGPHALGLSARSDTITEYNGGDGIIGVHGTNRPGSIGNAASLGCVRLPNDLITRLHELVVVGTPVEIRS